jgi:hypothetical protein
MQRTQKQFRDSNIGFNENLAMINQGWSVPKKQREMRHHCCARTLRPDTTESNAVSHSLVVEGWS